MAYKTVRGLINHLKKLEKQTFMVLKGYNKLTDEQKKILSFISGSLSNLLGEFDDAKDVNAA